jgi:hypothetical protein
MAIFVGHKRISRRATLDRHEDSLVQSTPETIKDQGLLQHIFERIWDAQLRNLDNSSLSWGGRGLVDVLSRHDCCLCL